MLTETPVVNMPLDLDRIHTAHERIRPYIHRTPVLTSERLNEASGASLFFKWENFQKVGAFKARGATNGWFGYFYPCTGSRRTRALLSSTTTIAPLPRACCV
jgi:threonine dehydratase